MTDRITAEPTTASSRSSLSNSQRSDKLRLIHKACQDHDFKAIVEAADQVGGLLSDDIRRLAWPILLGCASGAEDLHETKQEPWQDLPVRSDEEQVQKDVDRSFVYFPERDSKRDIELQKTKLYNVIIHVLRSQPLLCYFQGYHDIVSVLLLVLGPERIFDAVTRISLLRIRDYMLTNITPAVQHLDLIPAILSVADPKLSTHLAGTKPYYALSATLTLYAHDIQEYGDIARLYDFVLAHEPLMTIYLFVAIIIWRRKELLDVPPDEPEMLHFMLSKLPQPLDLEHLISQTLQLFHKYPPERLPGSTWSRISLSSVLKTSRQLEKSTDLHRAEKLLKKQTNDLYRAEQWQRRKLFLYRNRHSIFSVLATVLVGGISVWLRRSGNDQWIWMLVKQATGLVR